jgi:hypothetical protein
MLIAFFTGMVANWSLQGSATDRDAGRIKKLPEPTNKPFILGLADEIFFFREGKFRVYTRPWM